MDHAPLNLAHFHERRAEKFLRHYRYEDAAKAIETSLLYVQNAYNFCKLAKSIEVLNTQKWDYERKLHQIQMRRQQHERLNMKEIVPSDTNSVVLFRPEHSITAQSVAKSIDKTIQDFDAKFSTLNLDEEMAKPKQRTVSGFHTDEVANVESVTYRKIDQDPALSMYDANCKSLDSHIDPNADLNEVPSLAPLEMPSFNFNVLSSTILAENFQK